MCAQTHITEQLRATFQFSPKYRLIEKCTTWVSDKHTYTHASTGVQQISRFADAFEAAIFIDTESIEAHVPDQTLVLVCEGIEIIDYLQYIKIYNTRDQASVIKVLVIGQFKVCHTLNPIHIFIALLFISDPILFYSILFYTFFKFSCHNNHIYGNDH